MALCIPVDRGERIFLNRPGTGTLDPIHEFASEQIIVLQNEEYYEFENNLNEFMEDHTCTWDELHGALLDEAIHMNDIDCIRYIVRRMGEVRLIKEHDLKEKGHLVISYNAFKFNNNLGDLTTPLISNDSNIVEAILQERDPYRLEQDYAMWSDGKKLCMKLMSPDEAALASGDIEIYKLLKKYNVGWSNMEPECVFLSDDFETVKKYCQNGGGIEVNSEAMYWMSEDTSLLVAEKNKYYDIEKILRTANSIFLAEYLIAYDDINVAVLESWKHELRNGNRVKFTLEIFKHKCELSGCYCIPYNQRWMEERIDKCINIIHEYMNGCRSFYEAEDNYDETNGWENWDEFAE